MTASLMLGKELGYLPFWEDTPVTLQVAMVGTDGIVLASDKKTVRSGNDVVRESFRTTKILVDSAQGIAIAHSGNEFSEAVAKQILYDSSPVNEKLFAAKLQSFASEVWKQDPWQSVDRHGELIIVSKDHLRRILHVSLGPLVIGDRILGAEARPTWIEDKVRAGDRSNPAIFFSECYYDKKPIADLVFLAAHAVLSGRRFNPLIDGLEVVKCTSEGFEQLSEASVSELKRRSDELDARIRSEILTPLFT